MSNFPETDMYDRVLQLGVPAEELVLINSGAIEVVVGPEVRRAQDIDVVVSERAYRHLREQPGMEEEILPGFRHVQGYGYDIRPSSPNADLAGLQQRGYVQNGVYIAGLPDVYAHKQKRGLEKDEGDLQIIRDRLYGAKILPDALLEKELRFVESFMPEHLHGRPELKVAANGLMIVRTVFGHEKESVRTYRGTVETGGVPATYHAWEHSALGARDGQRNVDQQNSRHTARGLPPKFSDDERLAALTGYTNHDPIMGHGRRSVNPKAHDEKQSAELVARHLTSIGAPQAVVDGAYAGVMATTFNEQKKTQDIDPARGHLAVQELCAGSDMSTLRRPGADAVVALAVEDLSREAYAYGGALQKLISQLNAERPTDQPPIRITTIRQGLELIDQHPNFPVTKAGDHPRQMTLREAFMTHLRDSVGFYRAYKFPESWQLGSYADQEATTQHIQEIIAKIEAGELTAADAYEAVLPQTKTSHLQSPDNKYGNTNSNSNASVETVRVNIEAALSRLSIATIETLHADVLEVVEMLSFALQTTENETAASVLSQLTLVYERLTKARAMIASGTEKLRQYIQPTHKA